MQVVYIPVHDACIRRMAQGQMCESQVHRLRLCVHYSAQDQVQVKSDIAYKCMDFFGKYKQIICVFSKIQSKLLDMFLECRVQTGLEADVLLQITHVCSLRTTALQHATQVQVLAKSERERDGMLRISHFVTKICFTKDCCIKINCTLVQSFLFTPEMYKYQRANEAGL